MTEQQRCVSCQYDSWVAIYGRSSLCSIGNWVAQIMSAFEALDYLDDLPIEFIISKE